MTSPVVPPGTASSGTAPRLPASAARRLAALGAVACAFAVGLAAYASHGLDGAAAQRGGIAAAFFFAHGLALLLLAPGAGRLRLAALALLAFGMLLFAGSLAAAALAGWPTRLAPAGGLSLMAAWLIIAGDALRR
ncbi:DUF423 domain-containing protein [Arenimonas composti]|uniref:DUF423 domain-containing protein n=1 Tax=Arenimonas composti TR7-09 = DSM 18010 TaxID=1121013 RepID=A0A091BDW4_9GAMM|nr:DUF423 domain-containing protein [Arenimonas composti]KFN49732.1 hypothetical protein P873_09245 [Arenimonas composti TR7-09 = DSM 18010]